jgi:small subunit ribosomal protein S11
MLSVRSSLLAAARLSRLNSTTTSFNPYADSTDDLSSNSEINTLPPSPPPGSYPANPLRAVGRETPKYHLHVQATRNNTITTFTRPNGTILATFSGGSCGFKKGNRASYEAGYQCAVKAFGRIEKELEVNGRLELDVFFKGFGQGREALHRALLTSEGQNIRPLVKTVTDKTAIKIGGTRAPKARRL